MPSQAMLDAIDTLRDRREASASQPSPTLAERRAAFTPGDRLNPVPDDVVVREVRAGGVPAHWLAAPGVALLVAARDAGEELPAAAALMSPTVDLSSSGDSMTERVGQDPISTPAALGQFAADYLSGADPRAPLASPLFAALTGLPPILIQVGTADLLLSDSQRLAAAAGEAGVDVRLEIGEGLPHVYQHVLGTPEAAAATERIGKFLRARVP
ncbi:MAG TPA: alpha/beta hydrolase fold domain-containing protein [Streptosporangiaceae bacterium]